MTKWGYNIICSVVLVAVFICGWAFSSVFSTVTNLDKVQPFSIASNELKSPGDWVKEDDISIKEKYVIVKLANATWSKFTDTNSMDPVIDEFSNSIEIKPTSPEQLKIGDIISYKSTFMPGFLIHRIVDIRTDEKGLYYVVKGDNTNYADAEKVRFEQIKGVVVGVLY